MDPLSTAVSLPTGVRSRFGGVPEFRYRHRVDGTAVARDLPVGLVDAVVATALATEPEARALNHR